MTCNAGLEEDGDESAGAAADADADAKVDAGATAGATVGTTAVELGDSTLSTTTSAFPSPAITGSWESWLRKQQQNGHVLCC